MQTISFNGKTYNNLDEMPAEQRAAYEQVMSFMKDENHNGIPDMFEGDAIQKMMTMASTRVIVNGQEVQSFEFLPPEARAKFDTAMQKLGQLGILPQGMSGTQEIAAPQPPVQVTPSEPSFTQSPAFLQSSPSAISEDAGPRIGTIVGIAILAVFFLCVVAAMGFLLLNR
jgi:hypothetical protein